MQKLPSGKTVKVTSCHFTWGVEHSDRTPDLDSFAMEFVYRTPEASDATHEQEAKEAFELIRGVSELWNAKRASVTGFPTTKRKGKYDLFVFEHAANGQWVSTHSAYKVFAND